MTRSSRRHFAPAGPARPKVDGLLAAASLSPVPALFGLLTALAIGGYPEGGRWVAFAAAAALALVDGARQAYRDEAVTFDLLDLLLAALIAYGALSLRWSANPDGGIQTVIIAGACLMLGLYLKRYAIPAIMTAIAAGVGLGAAFALASNFWLPSAQWAGFGNSGYAAETLILCLPFLWILWRGQSSLAMGARTFALAVAAGAIGYVVIFTPSMIGVFVVVACAAIFSIIWAFRRGAIWGGLCAAAWIVLPIAAAWLGWESLHLTERILVRSELWLNAGFMILDRPLFGHGAGSFIEVYPLFKEAHGGLMPFVNLAFESYVTEAEAAHNEMLQLWTELGVVGLVPAVAVIALALKSAMGRMRDNIFVQAGVVALLAVLCESLLEYPFQRAATLFLAVVGLSFATHGDTSGVAQWRLPLPRLVTIGLIPFAAATAFLLLVAGYRQFEAEARLEQSRAPGIDATTAFTLASEAHALDPLHRRITATLPIMLDGLIRQRGLAAVPRTLIDQVYRDVDNGAHFNTAALVARAQLLLEQSGGNDPAFPPLLADLKRGSTRVAAAYAIEARYLIGQGRFDDARAVILEGQKYTEGRSSTPGADEAIRLNLSGLLRLTDRQIEARPH